MAVDEALLTNYQQGNAQPTVRVYRWQPACVSLGYFQRWSDVNHAARQACGVEVVRRLTGGRAILHGDELTYSVVVSEEQLGTRGVLATFRHLSEGVVAGLARLGITAELKALAEPRPREAEANCFAAVARCDLVCDGRKLVGSAQLRRIGTVLQHGSLPLSFDHAAATELLPGASDLRTRIIDLREAAGNPSLWTDCVAQALQAGFAAALRIEFIEGELSATEWALAESLAKTKYATSEWTQRR